MCNRIASAARSVAETSPRSANRWPTGGNCACSRFRLVKPSQQPKKNARPFNVIQAVVLAEYGGLTEPNAQGHRPLLDNNPARSVEAYFADVDWVVNRAEQLGLCIGMLPTCGDKWTDRLGYQCMLTDSRS